MLMGLVVGRVSLWLALFLGLHICLAREAKAFDASAEYFSEPWSYLGPSRCDMFVKRGTLFVAGLLRSGSATCAHQPAFAEPQVSPVVIAHRGGTPHFPQASTAAYESVANTTDFLECDLTITSDGVLVCQHEPDLSMSSNASKDRFRSILPAENITREWLNPVLDFNRHAAFHRADAKPYDGWYTPDYPYNSTIRTLSAPCNGPLTGNAECEATYYPLARLEEVWALASQNLAGVYLEVKHSTWHQGRRNRDMLSILLDFLRARSASPDRLDFPFPVYLQTFEIGDLIRLRYLLGYDNRNVFITGLSTVLHTTYNLPPDCCAEDDHLRRKMLRAFQEDGLGKFVRLPGTFGEMFFGTLAPDLESMSLHDVDDVAGCLGPSLADGPGGDRRCAECTGAVGGLKILPVSLRDAQEAEDSARTPEEKKAYCQDLVKTYASQMYLTCPTRPTDSSYNMSSFYAFRPNASISYAMDISCLVDSLGMDIRYVRRYPQIIKEAHERCIKVHLWTIKTEDDMEFSLKHGADGVFSDDVEMSKGLVERYSKH